MFLSFFVVLYIFFYLHLSPAGNEPCPQPQTSEHLAAIEIMKLQHIIILQNKIDLVKESQAKEQYEQILAFVKGKWLLDCYFIAFFYSFYWWQPLDCGLF